MKRALDMIACDNKDKWALLMPKQLLVESCSQDDTANASVLSVYLVTILYDHLELFVDIERAYVRSSHNHKMPLGMR